jgi:hypothetical protein
VSPGGGSRRSTELTVGRLMEHGRAKYQFRADQDPSYYMKVLTNRGERVLWGNGLAEALKSATTAPKIGDLVGVRRTGAQAVSTAPRERGSKPQYRTQWEVEKVNFFVERARRARLVRDHQTDVRGAVSAHPELKSSFLSIRSAEALAAERIQDPQDRERFLSLVREAIAGSINRGEPLPELRLRDKPSAPVPKPRRREDPTR